MEQSGNIFDLTTGQMKIGITGWGAVAVVDPPLSERSQQVTIVRNEETGLIEMKSTGSEATYIDGTVERREESRNPPYFITCRRADGGNESYSRLPSSRLI